MLSPASPRFTATRSCSTNQLESTVDLDAHRAASDLDELDLDDPHADEAA